MVFACTSYRPGPLVGLALFISTACVRPTAVDLPTDVSATLLILEIQDDMKEQYYRAIAGSGGGSPESVSLAGFSAASMLILPCPLEAYGLASGEVGLTLREPGYSIEAPIPAGRLGPSVLDLPEVDAEKLPFLELSIRPPMEGLDVLGSYYLVDPELSYFASDGNVMISLTDGAIHVPAPGKPNTEIDFNIGIPRGLAPRSQGFDGVAVSSFIALVGSATIGTTSLVEFNVSSADEPREVGRTGEPPAWRGFGPELLFARPAPDPSLLAVGRGSLPGQTGYSIYERGAWSKNNSINIPFDREQWGAAWTEGRWLATASGLESAIALTPTSATLGPAASFVTQAGPEAYWAASANLGIFQAGGQLGLVHTAGPPIRPSAMAGDVDGAVVVDETEVRYFRVRDTTKPEVVGCRAPAKWKAPSRVLTVGLTPTALFVVLQSGEVVWLGRPGFQR